MTTLYISGPDICGPGTKKVHVIFTYKGKNHLTKKEIRCKVCKFSVTNVTCVLHVVFPSKYDRHDIIDTIINVMTSFF